MCPRVPNRSIYTKISKLGRFNILFHETAPLEGQYLKSFRSSTPGHYSSVHERAARQQFYHHAAPSWQRAAGPTRQFESDIAYAQQHLPPGEATTITTHHIYFCRFWGIGWLDAGDAPTRPRLPADFFDQHK